MRARAWLAAVVAVNGFVAVLMHGGWDWLAGRAMPERPMTQEPVVNESMCAAWGPFTESAAMSPLIAEVEAAGGEVDVISHRLAVTPAYLVLVGPNGSFEVARRVREEFESQSIAGHLVVRGPFARSLEVGIFADRAQALARRARIAELGYQVDLHELRHPPRVFHLVARMTREIAGFKPPAMDCRAIQKSQAFFEVVLKPNMR